MNAAVKSACPSAASRCTAPCHLRTSFRSLPLAASCAAKTPCPAVVCIARRSVGDTSGFSSCLHCKSLRQQPVSQPQRPSMPWQRDSAEPGFCVSRCRQCACRYPQLLFKPIWGCEATMSCEISTTDRMHAAAALRSIVFSGLDTLYVGAACHPPPRVTSWTRCMQQTPRLSRKVCEEARCGTTCVCPDCCLN